LFALVVSPKELERTGKTNDYILFLWIAEPVKHKLVMYFMCSGGGLQNKFAE